MTTADGDALTGLPMDGEFRSLPTGLSNCSARRRCSSVACGPGEITLIASSTSTGVLDMTRTTGTSPDSLRPIKAVVMPAATDVTSLALKRELWRMDADHDETVAPGLGRPPAGRETAEGHP